jgi:hypothetical protein
MTTNILPKVWCYHQIVAANKAGHFIGCWRPTKSVGIEMGVLELLLLVLFFLMMPSKQKKSLNVTLPTELTTLAPEAIVE